ncbi:hypothetical protein CBW22_21900 [Pantoea sp. VS1]|uniref:restriction endonuclease n=1 Tax=Pantoea sp. VS1 TaxID=2003658 RepID=UPI000B50940F|nr:restriction endonuclease [Pantoea sp. VS1]OWS73604.1 hypothetical protein CBW22_21900 [Pantoea sp. VS1]
MKENDWRDYEVFVGRIQQSLLNAEGISHIKNINVEINKKLIDRSGIERQFDLYWEFQLGGQIYKSVIECKNYASAITIEKIDAFIGKANDIPGLRLIYATKTGYQSGAKTKAEQHKIDLLIVREGVDEDWTSSDGTPLVKTININIKAVSVPRIISFTPHVDAKWLESQVNLKLEDVEQRFGRTLNNEIFIHDKVKNERVSLHELQTQLLCKVKDIHYGKGSFSEKFEDAQLENLDGSLKLKLSSYALEYIYNKPINMISTIDYSNELLGIVHNYVTGNKKMIFNDGQIINMSE